ncbi:hypothetical protein DVH24_033701 [Malus domestica]|uniref:Protein DETOXIFICATION n=1 Tax=Malus domestica TaxID=3750 RepID=A0A498HTF0_MALDO|nr:hypothetical protein DVH24_033701 [Malus domestica]
MESEASEFPKGLVLVAVVTSFLIGVALWLALIITRDIYPSLFSSDSEVKALVKQLTPLLATCIVINNAQTLLSGVAVGAGWQAVVGYMNIICYYAFGVPLGLIMGYKLHGGAKASMAEDRIRKWGGEIESKENGGHTDSQNNGGHRDLEKNNDLGLIRKEGYML